MTYCCITCEFDKARANNAPGRRNLRPMIPPVAATRDAAAGATTSSVGGETPSELATPVGLGGQGSTPDTYPRAGRNTTGVSGLAVRHEADVSVTWTSECSEPRLGAVS